MATPARKTPAKKPIAKKTPAKKAVTKTTTIDNKIETKVDEVVTMANTAAKHVTEKTEKILWEAEKVLEENNENLWAASAYVFFLIPFLGKKTSLTMYHAMQWVWYTAAALWINIITNILHLRVLKWLISLVLLIVWIILIVSALRKEKKETVHLYTLGKKIIEFLKLEQYFSL